MLHAILGKINEVYSQRSMTSLMTKHHKIVSKIIYLTNKLMINGTNSSQELFMFFMCLMKFHWKAPEFYVGHWKSGCEKIKLTNRKLDSLHFLDVADATSATNKKNKYSVSVLINTFGKQYLTDFWKLRRTQPFEL